MTPNLPAIQTTLSSPNVVARIESRLGEKSGTFITSLLDLCGEDKNLSECDPNLVIKEALKAAGLDLPINKNLGFAYVIPYNKSSKVDGKWLKTKKPEFQMGFKGYIQLAIRTGKYKHLNAGVVYEGELMLEDRIKGTLEIGGEKASDKAIGYFCYMELINGFQKAVAWTKERVVTHAERFSKSYNSKTSPWKTDFDAMALKTMILQLVPKYGPMTIEMSTAMSSDRADFKGFDNQVSVEIEENANEEIIDIPTEEPGEMTDKEKKEIEKEEAAQTDNKGPGF
jgi:recombination protein RecT